MPTPKDKHDREHLRRLTVIQRLIDSIYDEAVSEAASIGADVRGVDLGKAFEFADYPLTKRRIDELVAWLRNQLEVAVVNGIRAEWTLANDKNNVLVQRVFGGDVDRIPEPERRRYLSTNESAREAFIQRTRGGLGLSEQVWKYADGFKTEMEMGIDLGIREGKDAAAMARDLKQYLRHPDKLFRRVRDEHGILHLSKRAAQFHPGRGVYRSSYLNARRLAVTETNMAYRTADHERWKDMDFVVGIEIHLSSNHTCKGRDGKPHPFEDICDQLKGKYPKDFKFTGWHPHCRCFATSILKTDEELAEDTRRILNGEQPTEGSVNEVTDVPEGFKEWVEKNEERIADARKKGTLPNFLRENSGYAEASTKETSISSSNLKSKAVEGSNEAGDPQQPPHTPEPSPNTSVPPPDLVTAEEANIIVECDAHREIMEIQTYKELEEYMTKNGVVTKIDLSSMPIDMAREVCATWAQIQHDWNLPPIELITDKLEDKTFGRGNGERIRLNRKTFGENANKNLQVEFKKSVTEFIEGRKKTIEIWRKRSEKYQEWIETAEKRGDEVSVKGYRKERKKIDKSIEKEEAIIKNHSRHNVFLSEKSMLRNMTQHESGHVVADRLLGMTNADTFLLEERLTSVEIKQMNDGITELFKKYKDNSGWLSVYGMENKKEFMSECMVLYSERGGEGLPKDVKAWFDKLNAMSLRKKS